MKARGRVFKYGSNIDTDVIIPARYLSSSDPEVLRQYCMIDIDKDFIKQVKPGDIIVGEKNFGCGSSREHAPVAIKAAGISCVVAESFARIFYRNSFNVGLPILESPEGAKSIQDGDEIEIDFERGEIHNISRNEKYKAQAYPEFIKKIIEKEGLVNYIREKV